MAPTRQGSKPPSKVAHQKHGITLQELKQARARKGNANVLLDRHGRPVSQSQLDSKIPASAYIGFVSRCRSGHFVAVFRKQADPHQPAFIHDACVKLASSPEIRKKCLIDYMFHRRDDRYVFTDRCFPFTVRSLLPVVAFDEALTLCLLPLLRDPSLTWESRVTKLNGSTLTLHWTIFCHIIQKEEHNTSERALRWLKHLAAALTKMQKAIRDPSYRDIAIGGDLTPKEPTSVLIDHYCISDVFSIIETEYKDGNFTIEQIANCDPLMDQFFGRDPLIRSRVSDWIAPRLTVQSSTGNDASSQNSNDETFDIDQIEL